jgi:hypothetical protein
VATIYFGAQVPVGTPNNGNWNDVSQWYSNPGSNQGKDNYPGTLLGRLPLLTDVIYITQWVTSGVAARVLTLTGVNNGVWTGVIAGDSSPILNKVAGLNDPTATWAGTNTVYEMNIRSGTVNFNITNTYEITGGTFNGNLISFHQYISGGTFNGAVSGRINIYGNPTFNGSLTNVQALSLYSGTFTKTITSWSGGSLGIFGGTYNAPSTPTAGLTSFSLYSGTMAQNIFTSAYTQLNVITIQGGTLSFAGDIQAGALGRAVQFYINQDFNDGVRFAGTDKNITVYSSTGNTYIRFGTASGPYDAGTYTGLITLLSSTGTGKPLYTIFGGTYTPPVQTLPLINVAYSTGKGINAALLYVNPGFATFNQSIAISGSSDILQSELA